MKVFLAGQRLRFMYTNHRGETAQRNVTFHGLDYGDNEWYTERTWFMRCWDLDREAMRSFAINKIDGETVEVL